MREAVSIFIWLPNIFRLAEKSWVTCVQFGRCFDEVIILTSSAFGKRLYFHTDKGYAQKLLKRKRRIRTDSTDTIFKCLSDYLVIKSVEFNNQNNSTPSRDVVTKFGIMEDLELISVDPYISGTNANNSNIQTEAALPRCSYKNVFWKYAANLQENTYT